MRSIVEWMDQEWYPGEQKNWDDQLFRDQILANINTSSVILDLGAGAGIVQQMNFRKLAMRVCGVDLDQRVVTNAMLDEGKVSDAQSIPYPDNTFDLAFADNVVEHLDDPEAIFREVRRVLKPDGLFLFKTPNRLHYMPLIARCTPHAFHQWVNRLRGRAEVDTFPTRYAANTPAAISRIASAAGLLLRAVYLYEGRPEYLRIFWPAYFFGMLYERVVNRFQCLARFRILLIASTQKPRC